MPSRSPCSPRTMSVRSHHIPALNSSAAPVFTLGNIARNSMDKPGTRTQVASMQGIDGLCWSPPSHIPARNCLLHCLFTLKQHALVFPQAAKTECTLSLFCTPFELYLYTVPCATWKIYMFSLCQNALQNNLSENEHEEISSQY